MANELYTSTEGDLLATESMAGEIILTLADRQSIRNHPAIVFLGDANGAGAATHDIPIAGLDGYDEMAAVAEDSAVSNTALTTAVAQVSVARQSIRREMSDLLRGIDATGVFNPARMGRDAAFAAEMRLTSMLTGILDDFSTTAGTSGQNCSVDDVYDAQFALLLASVDGPYLWVPHPRQFADFESDLRSEGGAVQHDPATRDLLRLRGPGFQGTWNGIDIITSSRVPTANSGADRASGMFGRGAVGYRELSIPPTRHLLAKGTVFAGPVMIEPARDSDKANDVTVANYYVGVTEIEDGRGVTIITDA